MTQRKAAVADLHHSVSSYGYKRDIRDLTLDTGSYISFYLSDLGCSLMTTADTTPRAAVRPRINQTMFPPKICLEMDTAYRTDAPPGPNIRTPEERT